LGPDAQPLSPAEAVHVQAELEGQAIALKLWHQGQSGLVQAVAFDAQLQLDYQHSAAHLHATGRVNVSVWLFGPALILLLARRRIFCLHASAIRMGEGALLLLGESGAGKSTMARAAGGARLCDDISPIQIVQANQPSPFSSKARDRTSVDCGYLLPQFPQLKLIDQNPNLPARVPICGIVFLRPPEPTQDCVLVSDQKTALRRLLAHTVATRLFPAEDSATLLPCLALLAANTPCFSAAQARNAVAPEQAAANLLARLEQMLSC
jgi:hypothetical protein